MRRFQAIVLITAVAACNSGEENDGHDGSESQAITSVSSADETEDEADVSGAQPNDATEGSGAAEYSASNGTAVVGTSGSLIQPNPAFLPTPTGPCPDFKDGTLTFQPANIPARNVRIFMSDAAKTSDGPLIFYWHGTGSQPTEATVGIGTAQLDALKAQGGIVAAPVHDPAAGTFPWFLVQSSSRDDDLRVADEVLACAIQKVGVDVRRIHSMGMSAGGLNTTQMSYRRSGYIASAVTYSGGRLSSIPTQDSSNKFAAMIFHGGPTDVVGISFQTASQNYYNDLKSKSQFGILCNHGQGHTIPTTARAAVAQFLKDHPFGTVPSPYAGGLPSSMPSFCSL